MAYPVGTLSQGKLKTRQLESLAFYLGAHDIDPTHTQGEIEARHAQEVSEAKQEPLRALHSLEAKLQRARRERPEAEAIWNRIRKEVGETPPPYFHALLMAFFACIALGLDALFLAPSMDILNIADSALQYLAAAGLAALCTVYFEFAALLYVAAEDSRPKRLMAIGTASVGAASLVVWGILRGYQLGFAAGLNGNPLGQFLAAHPVLSSVLYIFITLAAPIVGAAALLFGWRELSRARTWHRVRQRFEGLRAAEVVLARNIQAAQEHLQHLHLRKQAQSREWKAIFAQFYERGQRNGARRETLWSVVRKSLLGGLIAIPMAFFVPFGLSLALPAIPILALFIYFNHCRHHPSHDRYLAQENTRFAVVPDRAQTHNLPRFEQRHLLTKGDGDDLA